MPSRPGQAAKPQASASPTCPRPMGCQQKSPLSVASDLGVPFSRSQNRSDNTSEADIAFDVIAANPGRPDRQGNVVLPGEEALPSSLPRTTNSDKPSTSVLESTHSVDFTSWRSTFGFSGIRRAFTFALWSPAVYAYQGAASVASAVVPFLWDNSEASSSRETSGGVTWLPAEALTCDAGGLRAPLSEISCGVQAAGSSSSSSRRQQQQGGASLPAPPLPESPPCHMRLWTCVRCPHCSGVFRIQDAEHEAEMGGATLALKAPDVRLHSHPARKNVETNTDGARKLSSSNPHPRPASPAESPPPKEGQGSEAVAGTGYVSEGPVEAPSTQVLVGTRQPRWIRFLARRLTCIHVRKERRVLDSRTNSQGQPAAGRRKHLRLRHRRRLNQDTPSIKEWRHGSEAKVSVSVSSLANNADQTCAAAFPAVSCVDLSNDLPHAYSRSTSACKRQPSDPVTCRSEGAASGQLTTQAGLQRSFSGGTAAEGAPCGGTVGGVGALDELKDAETNCQAIRHESCAPSWHQADLQLEPGAPPVDLWPLISLHAKDGSSLRDAFDKLEERRMKFNLLLRQTSCGSTWNPRVEMQQLSELLVSASVLSMLVLDCAMPCVHSHDGLQVWKGESGVGSFACRATFLLPVEPRLYAMFASNGELRCQWDKNVTEQHVVEELDEGQDVCYVAFRRIATVYPRDVVTLRVKCRLPMTPRVVKGAVGIQSFDCGANLGEPDCEEEMMAYSSMSCSIDHPDAPEIPGRVRMDVRVNAYLAKPVRTPFGLWSEITLVNESDPGGWIPAAITRNLSAKLLPSTVEKFSSQLMKHYNIPWTGSATGFAARKLKMHKLVLN